jgi:hypothetical protein
MELSRRIQRVWGYIEIHWDDDNGFIGILINGEWDPNLESQPNNTGVSAGILKDHLIINLQSDDQTVHIWKKGDTQSTKFRHGFETIFLNDSICYFHLGYPIDGKLMCISTPSFVEWILTVGLLIFRKISNPSGDDIEIKDLNDRSQVLGTILRDTKIIGMDNVGHVLLEGFIDGLFDYSVDPPLEINVDSDVSPVFDPYGNYIARMGTYDKIDETGHIHLLTVEKYVTRTSKDDKIIKVTRTNGLAKEIRKAENEVDEGGIPIWIDRETVLVYKDNAFLLNVVTYELIDITRHTKELSETITSLEVFVLSNGKALTIDEVRKWSRWLRYHTLEIPHIPEKVIDRIYQYAS